MPLPHQMFYDYCRVVLHLPAFTPNEKFAADAIIDTFKTRYLGSTYTSTTQSIFTGVWLDYGPTPPEPVEDSIAFLIIDMPCAAAHNKKLGREVDIIRGYSFMKYAQLGAPQDEIWIVVTPIMVRQNFTPPGIGNLPSPRIP